MVLFYCLADTAVNGKIIIQGKSVTYTASASALASANTSFKDASTVATIDSNTAATIAARKTVDDILKNYAYVLADLNITEMINNSLKTTLRLIIPIFLKDIADTVDNKTYTLRQDTTIAENEFLLIPNKKTFNAPAKFIFRNNGRIQVGETGNVKSNNKNNHANMTKLSAGPAQCGAETTYNQYVGDRGYVNNGTITVNPGQCLNIIKSTSATVATPSCFNQGGTVNNYGQITVSGVKFINQSGSLVAGVVNNYSTGSFYSNPTGI
jgi:hypothetical protein